MHVEASDNIKRHNARIQELFGFSPAPVNNHFSKAEDKDEEDDEELMKACGDNKPMMKADEDELGDAPEKKDSELSDEELKEKMAKLQTSKMGDDKTRSILKQDV